MSADNFVFFHLSLFFSSEKHRCISYTFVLKFHSSKSLYQNHCYFNDHKYGCPDLTKPGHHSITSKKWYLCKCLNMAICGHQSNLRECPNLVNSGQNLPAMVSFKIFLGLEDSGLLEVEVQNKALPCIL